MIALTEAQVGALIGLAIFAAIIPLSLLIAWLFPDPGQPEFKNYMCLVCGHQTKHFSNTNVRPHCRCGNHMTRLP